MVQPSFNAAPATMKPRQTAITMAQATQRGGNPGDRLKMCRRRCPAGIAQRRCRPSQQGKDLKQLFGIAGQNAARGINLGAALTRQRAGCRGNVMLHILKRQTGINQP